MSVEHYRESTIRLSVCFGVSDASVAIHAQVYDPKTNEPKYEIGMWSLDEFSKLAPTLLRAYRAGFWAASNITGDATKIPKNPEL